MIKMLCFHSTDVKELVNRITQHKIKLLTTLDAHLVVRSTKDNLLLSKINSLLAAWTLARHLDLLEW